MSEVNDKSAFLAKAGHPLGLSEEQGVEAIVEDTPEQPPLQNEQPSVEDVVHQEEAPSQEEVKKEEAEEQEVFSAFYEEDVPEVEEQIQETKVSDKVKYNLKDYIEQHSNEVSEYFKYKNLDVDSMSNEDLIRYKLQYENPAWDASDVEEELKSKYGIGLQERVIDEDGLEEDIQRDKEYNQIGREHVKQGERLLKTEVQIGRASCRERGRKEGG